MPFKIVSDFVPTGDQPTAIKQLVEGLKNGDQSQTLLGVTGSGKTFTIANVIRLVIPDLLDDTVSKFVKSQLRISLARTKEVVGKFVVAD